MPESVATWDGTTVAPNTTGSGWTVGSMAANPALNDGVSEPADGDTVYVGVWAAGCSPGYASDPVFRWGSMATSEAAAVSGNKYFEFTFSRTDNGAFTPDHIVYNAGRGGSATPRGLVVRTSADAYATTIGGGAIPTVRPTWTNYDVDLSAIGEVTSLTVRFYAWSTGTASHTTEADDFSLTATVAPGVDITLTVGSPTAHPLTVATPTGHALTPGSPTGHPLTIAAPWKDPT